ncbi:hypothetical protein DUNSADRAFT_7128 [Dunaliella salina]|uniref:Encoded protein n=1 Tax=Dunaliella salina TaxID=3046 RepID=A0ABQ7GLZ0_DUNSA|nr:hypothetical protein DUNSADRAFT_7128 [Dunaliella salina]|eukprot:KAF5835626.1 hypothetical protein DUNSADRAFT_7128 [Dunaliella salina]
MSPPWSRDKQGVGKAKQQRAATRNSPTKQSQHLGSAGPKARTRSAARSAASAARGSNDSWRPTRPDRPSAGAERSSVSSNGARSSTVGTRPRGILPGADYEYVRYTGIPYPSGNHLLTRPLSAGVGPDVNKSGTFGAQDQQLRTPPRPKGSRGAAQAGVPGSPLDDLLVHVNSLLKDFDTRFAASSTPSRSGAVRGAPVTNFSVERANDVD